MKRIPADALRDLTDKEKLVASAIHRLPGQPWSEILADLRINAAIAGKARTTLESLGVVERYGQEYVNSVGHTRYRAVYRISLTGHPWVSEYDAWLNAGRPADSCPMPTRSSGRIASDVPSERAKPLTRIPRGKIHSERQRVLETFLRNLGAPWSQVRMLCRIHLGRVNALRQELQSDGVLLPCIDRYRDALGREILRTIFLPDESKPEVIATRKQYGLVRPHTPQARRDALDPPHHGKDLTVPLSMFPNIVGIDEDPIKAVSQPVPPAPTKLAEIAHQVAGHRGTERETPAPIKAQAPFKPLTLDIPTVPRTGGLLANLDINAMIAEQEARALPREEDDWKVAAMREQEAEEARALQVTPDIIGVAVADTHDIDPAVEAVDEAPQEEALGFTTWTFPDSE